MTLLPVEEAQARLLAMAPPLDIVAAPLVECAGRWLAQDVKALRSQPAHDLSAMDGYAVRHADWPGPWKVEGESAAGSGALPPLSSVAAMRIFTGAPLPPGADTVLIQENVARNGDSIAPLPDTEAKPAQHVRKQGADFFQEQAILTQGTRLTPVSVALAAVAGHATLPVARRPRIALLSSGDELAAPATALALGKLPASNGPMLTTLLAPFAEVTDLGIVPDSLESTAQAIADARGFDILVTTGGASVGDHDHVGAAFRQAGGTLDFWKIRMRPGKPMMAGALDGTLFLLPLVRRLAGAPNPLPAWGKASLAEDIRAGGERDEYMRGTVEDGTVQPLLSQDSAGLLALSQANCLLLRRAGQPAATAGSPVDIMRL
jgi:molybdopterin molybdotransferase